MPPRTKHCRLCEACCEGFDHHCLWLMRCIGRGNHCQFVVFCFLLGFCNFLFVMSGSQCEFYNVIMIYLSWWYFCAANFLVYSLRAAKCSWSNLPTKYEPQHNMVEYSLELCICSLQHSRVLYNFWGAKFKFFTDESSTTIIAPSKKMLYTHTYY